MYSSTADMALGNIILPFMVLPNLFKIVHAYDNKLNTIGVMLDTIRYDTIFIFSISTNYIGVHKL